MAKPKIGKPPAGLKDDQLHAWFEDQFEDAYEKMLFDHREKVRKAEADLEAAQTEIKELKEKTPEEGDVLLKGDDAKKWEKLQEIKVDELLAEAEEGRKTVRRAFLREAAEAANYNPKTFTQLVELQGVNVVAGEADDGGKVYQVEVEKDGKTEKVALTEHFETTYADWLPALATTQQPDRKTTLPPATPPTGRLPTSTRQKPADAQRALLEKRKAEREASKNVVLQGLTPKPSN